MTKFRTRIPLLLSYVERVRQILRREATFSYGRDEFYRDFWKSSATEVGADIESIGSEIFRVSKSGRRTMVQQHNVNSDTYFSRLLVDQKPLVSDLLRQHGYATPEYMEYDIRSVDRARQFMRGTPRRYVIKPRRGGGGEGITTGINDDRRLVRASVRAAAFVSEKLMIEEQFPGESFRLLFLKGELLDVILRQRPVVVGDGESTIRKLIQKENELRRLGKGERSLYELKADLDCEYYLHDHDLSLSDVPEAGVNTVVKNVVNENACDENLTVLEQVHDDYRKLGKQITTLLDLNLIGLDVMCSDISLPPLESGAIINEINIPPGMHYHVLVKNSELAVPVGPRILEFLLADSRISTSTPVANG